MRSAVSIGIGLLLIMAAIGWFLTAPQSVDPATIAQTPPDLENGETLFYAGGCASCHAGDDAEGEAKLILTGGHRLQTPFGTFVAPNISPDPANGIGDWTNAQFINAMRYGTSPSNEHYYPAFPYASYARMSDADLIDLWGFLQTLPASDRANEPNELGFPFNIRRAVGVWKLLYWSKDFVTAQSTDPAINRGRFLVEGPGHCGECHTPRDALGGLDTSQWMAGAPNPAGKGSIPNITPGDSEFATWSVADIVEFLTSGFTPEYDSVGGSMTAVVDNTSHLSQEDREAIALYLKELTPKAKGN